VVMNGAGRIGWFAHRRFPAVGRLGLSMAQDLAVVNRPFNIGVKQGLARRALA